MIDNVILLITGTLHERNTQELLARCHPLGRFDAMPALCVATTVAELYNTVLVETPLAPYVANCLSAQDLDELNIEIIRNTLYKAYLEDFYDYCQELGGATAEVMGDILQVNEKHKEGEEDEDNDSLTHTQSPSLKRIDAPSILPSIHLAPNYQNMNAGICFPPLVDFIQKAMHDWQQRMNMSK